MRRMAAHPRAKACGSHAVDRLVTVHALNRLPLTLQCRPRYALLSEAPQYRLDDACQGPLNLGAVNQRLATRKISN